MNKKVTYHSLLSLTFFALFLMCGCEKGREPAQAFSDSAITYAYPLPDENAGAQELHRYAASQLGKGNFEEALHFSSLAYDKAKEAGDVELIAKLLNNIGQSHWRLGDYRSALDSYEESGRIAGKLRMDHLLALTYTNRALILKEEEAYKTAKKLNGQAIAILEKLSASRDLAIVYNNHGQIFKIQQEMDSARFYYLKAAAIYDTVDFKDGKSATYHNLADIYAHLNQKDKAISYARQSLQLGLQSESKVRIGEGYRQVSEVYKKFHVPDSALAYQEKYADYQQLVYEKNLSDKLAEYQGRFGSELQKLKIENLEKEKKLTRSRIWLFIGGMVSLLLCIAFFVYRRFSAAKTKRRQLQTALQHSRDILEVKEKELVAYILDVSQKNKHISELKKRLSQKSLTLEAKISELIKQRILTDEEWNRFKSKFSQIFPDFLGKIRNYERITEAEVRYLVLLYLKLSPKEMSDVLGLSDTTIHKYKMRLKKKLQEEGFDSVEDFMDRL